MMDFSYLENRHNMVETLPVLFSVEVFKVSKLRQEIKEGLHDQVETPTQVMINAHDIQQNEQLQLVSQQEDVEPRQSLNIESLYNLTEQIDSEMRYVMNPPYNGRFSHDRRVDLRVKKYHDTTVKKFARMIKIYIDSLIQTDGYPQHMFGDYVRLTKLVQTTHDEMAEEYLLKLVNIARQMIPPNLSTNNTFVVDSNAVDPNKVNG